MNQKTIDRLGNKYLNAYYYSGYLTALNETLHAKNMTPKRVKPRLRDLFFKELGSALNYDFKYLIDMHKRECDAEGPRKRIAEHCGMTWYMNELPFSEDYNISEEEKQKAQAALEYFEEEKRKCLGIPIGVLESWKQE